MKIISNNLKFIVGKGLKKQLLRVN